MPASWGWPAWKRSRASTTASPRARQCTASRAPVWAATDDTPGVHLLRDLSAGTVEAYAQRIAASRQPGDLVVFSVHWGGNWGWEIPPEQKQLARALIDEAGVDLVHGHSSHHPRGIEVHNGRPILHGCGDFLNDYEGIGGHEAYRGDLTLMYFPRFDAAGRLDRFTLIPMRIRRLSLEHADTEEAEWLRQRLDEEGRKLNTRLVRHPDNVLELHWSRP
jgi:poly-gamma-glutamate synthesis protein (capsule biosynthesis protein)